VAYLAYVRSAGWVETGLGETDETLRSTLVAPVLITGAIPAESWVLKEGRDRRGDVGRSLPQTPAGSNDV